MSLRECEGDAVRAWARLCQRWGQASAVWEDGVKIDFQQRFWEPLEQAVPGWLSTLSDLMERAEEARRELDLDP